MITSYLRNTNWDSGPNTTRLATIRLVYYINKEIDKNTPVNIYFDLSNAFAIMHLEVLLFKMIYYGVLNIMHTSNFQSVNSGVPQGSIMGPLFFSIYTHDLVTVRDKINYKYWVGR